MVTRYSLLNPVHKERLLVDDAGDPGLLLTDFYLPCLKLMCVIKAINI